MKYMFSYCKTNLIMSAIIAISVFCLFSCAKTKQISMDSFTDSEVCPEGEKLCGSICTNTLKDHSNCGECGKECNPLESCYEGNCVVECPQNFTPCSGTCVDLLSDSDNCGECENKCTENAFCNGGICEIHLSGQTSGHQIYEHHRVVIDEEISVKAYNGTDDVSQCDENETGCLFIEAREIIIERGGKINAAGKGYGGGGGGGGAPGNAGGEGNIPCTGQCVSCLYGRGGNGVNGGEAGQDAPQIISTSTSGSGGKGGGPYGGAGGSSVSSSGSNGAVNGTDGHRGGYATPESNGDTSSDESLFMGSGGGGGSGGASASEHFYNSVGGSGGGGAGNPGGGYVKLVATEKIAVTGDIITTGYDGKTGNGRNGTDGWQGNELTCDLEGSGGDGGHAGSMGESKGGIGVNGYFQPGYNQCIDRQCENFDSGSVSGGNGGKGGAGAGGGVLLKAPSVIIEGTIDASGGGSNLENGGTVKIFHQNTPPSTEKIKAGRIYIQIINSP